MNLFNLNVKRLDKEVKLLSQKVENEDAGFDIFAKEDLVLVPGKNVIHSGLATQLEYKGFDQAGFMLEKHNFRNPQIVNVCKSMIDYMFQTQFRPWIQIRDKSGRAGIGLEISAGIVDKQYTGEIVIIIRNQTDKPIKVSKDEKLTQLIPMLTPICEVVEKDELLETSRGSGKMGSTGLK